MTILHPRAVNVTMFTWIPESHMYVAEISDFGKSFRFDRVFDDACDEGLTLVNRFGTDEIVFVVCHTESKEGDILYWDLEAAKKPNRYNFTLRIFND
jgi:hypothetical protein